MGFLKCLGLREQASWMHTHLVSFVELSYIYSSSASVAWDFQSVSEEKERAAGADVASKNPLDLSLHYDLLPPPQWNLIGQYSVTFNQLKIS